MSHNQNNKGSYGQILKSTSILGSVQVFTILINIIKNKAIAILLGSAGVGLISLFTTAITFITSFTNLGLGTSAVKNIATASEGEEEHFAQTVTVFQKLIWITALLGFSVTLIFSAVVSHITFGNSLYTYSFMALAISFVFTQLNVGHNVLFQGLRKIQTLARSTVLGALLGLVFSLPIYYFFREKGIVPAIILSALATFLASSFYMRKLRLKRLPANKEIFKKEGGDMVRMGILISMSALITALSSYVLRIYINHQNGLNDVGLFSAGFAIISVYISMVFSAMATDFYPRLSMISYDNQKSQSLINEQAEIAILILAPILLILIVFIKWAIIILYSPEFVGAVTMIHWAIPGIFFQALSWSMSYILLAKGASKLFFWNELIARGYMLLLNIIGYKLWGLPGLGISFFVGYIFYFIQMAIVSKMKYQIRLQKEVLKLFSIQFLLGCACLAIVYYLNEWQGYLVGILLILISSLYSWKEINKRIDLVGKIKSRL